MGRKLSLSLASAVTVSLLGCSAADGSHALLVGSQSSGGAGGGPSGSGGAFSVTAADAAAPKALSAHVESPRGVAVTFVTLSCSNACADVLAVASGGFPSYSFRWEDGSTNPARRVCPSSTTHYEVSVTDTGVSSIEFKREAQTVNALLTADVIQCPDGGPGKVDAGDSPAHGLCLSNPSFEGSPAGTAGNGSPFSAAPWADCVFSGADVLNGTSLPPPGTTAFSAFPSPTDGDTYAALAVDPLFGGDVSEPFCAPLRAGSTYALTLDLASVGSIGSAASIEIWGATSSCSFGQLLWSSPPAEPNWKTYCATLAPTSELSHLTLRYRAAVGSAYLVVDHLSPVEKCP